MTQNSFPQPHQVPETEPKCVQNPSKIPNPAETFKEQLQVYQMDKYLIKSQKNRSKKRVFKPNQYKIEYLSFPMSLQDDKRYKRKYRIQIKYRDLKDPKNKLRVKTVFFGQKGVDDYVDDHCQQKKMYRVNLMKKVQDPFSPRHFRLMLLNRCLTMKQAYFKYLDSLNIKY